MTTHTISFFLFHLVFDWRKNLRWLPLQVTVEHDETALNIQLNCGRAVLFICKGRARPV